MQQLAPVIGPQGVGNDLNPRVVLCHLRRQHDRTHRHRIIGKCPYKDGIAEHAHSLLPGISDFQRQGQRIRPHDDRTLAQQIATFHGIAPNISKRIGPPPDLLDHLPSAVVNKNAGIDLHLIRAVQLEILQRPLGHAPRQGHFDAILSVPEKSHLRGQPVFLIAVRIHISLAQIKIIRQHLASAPPARNECPVLIPHQFQFPMHGIVGKKFQ